MSSTQTPDSSPRKNSFLYGKENVIVSVNKYGEIDFSPSSTFRGFLYKEYSNKRLENGLADIGDGENKYQWYQNKPDNDIETILSEIDIYRVIGIDQYLCRSYPPLLVTKNCEITGKTFGYYADTCCDETILGSHYEISFDNFDPSKERVTLTVQQIHDCCTGRVYKWIKFSD